MDIWNWSLPFGLKASFEAKNSSCVLEALLSLSSLDMERHSYGVVPKASETTVPSQLGQRTSRDNSRNSSETGNASSYAHSEASRPTNATVVSTVFSATRDLMSSSSTQVWSSVLYPAIDDLQWLYNYKCAPTILSAMFWYLLRLGKPTILESCNDRHLI